MTDDTEEEFYPGSKTPRRSTLEKAEQAGWDVNPIMMPLGEMGGPEREFFTIGALADALHRTPMTIRRWEREGVIPRARFFTQASTPNGRFRLYTRAQIEGLLALAKELHITDTMKKVSMGDFPVRAFELFRGLDNEEAQFRANQSTS